jgi:putative FmdB family regulatory protein
MPTYKYRCRKCNNTFELIEHISEHASARHRCPKCGSDGVVTVVSPFFARTARKS